MPCHVGIGEARTPAIPARRPGHEICAESAGQFNSLGQAVRRRPRYKAPNKTFRPVGAAQFPALPCGHPLCPSPASPWLKILKPPHAILPFFGKSDMSTGHETVLILDFGSQYTQLIARRIREAGVYSEIVPFNTPWEEIQRRNPVAIILSGGPSSVFEESAPWPDPRVFDFAGPILGICYGMQLLARHFGGNVEPSTRREYGKAMVAR